MIVRQKVSWTGLICHTHQHYHRQWLPNTKWANSRSAWTRDRWMWIMDSYEVKTSKIAHHNRFYHEDGVLSATWRMIRQLAELSASSVVDARLFDALVSTWFARRRRVRLWRRLDAASDTIQLSMAAATTNTTSLSLRQTHRTSEAIGPTS